MAHLDLEGAAGGSAELTVHPEHRRAGLGTALVRELLAEQPAGGALRLWAHGGHPGAAAIAARLGLRTVRELLAAAADHDRAAGGPAAAGRGADPARSGSASTSRSSCG